ncbi:hypothetical protein [Salipaludibacillus daqingensis]|uniref:hypothetical protein n=1 Tax=Salipaludibacillus daqingensis TaxID=3041001 RepID=UPI002473DC91|nr:hypothetical protein [Salipaludibacillus daqingensis]
MYEIGFLVVIGLVVFIIGFIAIIARKISVLKRDLQQKDDHLEEIRRLKIEITSFERKLWIALIEKTKCYSATHKNHAEFYI